MSSLSRTLARESKRSHGLMEKHQPPGAYQEAEARYNEARQTRKAVLTVYKAEQMAAFMRNIYGESR